MTADELRAVFAAMSARPWRQGRVEKHHVFVLCADGFGPERVLLRMNEHFPHEADAAAIAALANHADPLVDLVVAVERWHAAWSSRIADDRVGEDGETRAVIDALRIVHEVKP